MYLEEIRVGIFNIWKEIVSRTEQYLKWRKFLHLGREYKKMKSVAQKIEAKAGEIDETWITEEEFNMSLNKKKKLSALSIENIATRTLMSSSCNSSAISLIHKLAWLSLDSLVCKETSSVIWEYPVGLASTLLFCA